LEGHGQQTGLIPPVCEPSKWTVSALSVLWTGGSLRAATDRD